MEVLKNFSEYRKHKPEYKAWKSERSILEAKRESYIKQNGIPEEQKNQDIKRALAVLSAVDVMDEYSQSRAENMELATQSTRPLMAEFIVKIGVLPGALLLLLPQARKGLANMGNKIINANNFKAGKIFDDIGNFDAGKIMYALPPIVSSMICSVFGGLGLICWGASKEVNASRIGRYEAMAKDLSSPNHFAVLTDEQQKEVEEKAKGISIPKKEKKKVVQGTTGGIRGLIKAYKEMFVEDKSYMPQRDKLNNQIGEDRKKFETVSLSEKDIENAKKDQQLIGNIVEKIDIASQDYAENVELATNTISTVALAGGGLIGFLTNKVLPKAGKIFSEIKNKLFPNFNLKQVLKSDTASKIDLIMPKILKAMPVVAGLAFAITLNLFAVKVQKQASRVGRFKVKEELKNNPEKILYVDDDKTKDIQNYTVQKTKKPNFFSFILKVFKDNKEYNKYIETKGIEDKKKRKALDTIKLTPEQEKEAKRLQNNVFKTFNEVDEKSQSYAESMEAVGEMVEAIAPNMFMTSGLAIGLLAGKKSIKSVIKEIVKMVQSGQKVEVSNAIKMVLGGSKAPIIGMLAGMVPAILLDIYITKEQKNASRVADMLALNELNDYRNYADYSGSNTVNQNNNPPAFDNTRAQTNADILSGTDDIFKQFLKK